MPLRLAIASQSLGRPGIHDLEYKLQQASQNGFQGMEIFVEDLEHFAHKHNIDSLITAAHQVWDICNDLGLEVVCLQPLLFYEGLLNRNDHEQQIHQIIPLWFDLADALKTDMIQVPSNFLTADPDTGSSRTTGDLDTIVSDLRELADLGAKRGLRFAYESLAWANHVDTWEVCWDIVQRVDRNNFGLCLDTFNIAARVYADPTAVSGKTENAESDIEASIARMKAHIKVEKVFFVQVVDGERLMSPLVQGHEFYVKGQPSRMSWSRNARLFPFEEHKGGYLPVVEIARVFFEDLHFANGWVSLELFSRTLADPRKEVPAEHAERGFESWKKLVKTLKLETSVTGQSADL